MLEYFGFYAPHPETPELEHAPHDQHEDAMARAARLGDRTHHTPSAVPVGRCWERTPPRER